jgi:molybdopterin biosynthesis enzyme MoaB
MFVIVSTGLERETLRQMSYETSKYHGIVSHLHVLASINYGTPVILMPSDRHIASLAFCEVIRLAVGVCLGIARRVLGGHLNV